MIPAEQVERMIAEAVRLAVHQATTPLQDALAQAKQMIAKLQTQLYGTRAETSHVVLTAEGQQLIDTTWGLSHETTPAPPTQERREQVVRTPRDRRGLVQRYPQLRLDEVEAQLPPELAEQVANGTLIARRSGRHHDELVAPRGRPFLRRIHEIELVKAATAQVVLQVMPDRIVPGGDLADETMRPSTS